jgi:hypothetical protein
MIAYGPILAVYATKFTRGSPTATFDPKASFKNFSTSI